MTEQQHAHPGPADPAPALDLDAIEQRAALSGSQLVTSGATPDLLRASQDDVRDLIALVRRLIAENEGQRWKLREWDDWYKHGEETCPSPEDRR